MAKKQLIILHLDGVGYYHAQNAMRDGHMPFLKELIEKKGYEMLEYRSGIPSTTPYVQAGLMYGDNAEIPAFRWYDRQKKKMIQLMGVRTFYEVDDKYFNKNAPLMKGGATIAALYAGGSQCAFGVSYVEKGTSQWTNSLARKVYLHLLLNPKHHIKWLIHSLKRSFKIGWQIIKHLVKRRYADWVHFPLYVLEQLFLHYPSAVAVRHAIQDGYPVIYAGFYSYDNVAHIFGHRTSYSNSILKDIDHSVSEIVESLGDRKEYELVILSDHGETQFTYLKTKIGMTFAQYLATILPTYQILEYPGKTIREFLPSTGKILIAYSGGLAHLYDSSYSSRMTYTQMKKKFPDLIQKILAVDEIACAIVKDGDEDVLFYKDKKVLLSRPLDTDARKFLDQFDDPKIIVKQLKVLNSFKNSGDIILITRFEGAKQVSFEPPVCGHGSIGGNQARPFILVRKKLRLDTSDITDAKDLYPFLMSLRS